MVRREREVTWLLMFWSGDSAWAGSDLDVDVVVAWIDVGD